MENLFNFTDLRNKNITTDMVVEELDKIASVLFRMTSDSLEGHRMISQLWMEVSRTQFEIMCRNNDKYTKSRLRVLEKNIQFIKAKIA